MNTNLTACTVTFIVSLTQVESLKGTLSFLARWVERWPWIEDLLALIAPLVLILLNTTVLPLLLKSICRFELPVSESTLESSSFVKMTSFVVRLILIHDKPAPDKSTLTISRQQIIQTFFVSTVSGTITAELTNILKNPKLGVDFLATSLPGMFSLHLASTLLGSFSYLTVSRAQVDQHISSNFLLSPLSWVFRSSCCGCFPLPKVS